MSAAETIAAAIEKLEREHAAVAGGRWGKGPSTRDQRATLYASTNSTMYDADVDLVLTLHRTIDPDLAFLRAAAESGISEAVVTSPEQFKGVGATLYRAAVDLARAILGEAS